MTFYYHHKPPQSPEAIEQAHECPVPDCTVLCSPGHIACRVHWCGVPWRERSPLIAAFQRRQLDPVTYDLACETAHVLVLKYAQLARGADMCSLNGR